MSILTLIVYLIASMFLGFILKKIEIKKRDNLVDYVVAANIYMIVLSGIFDFYKILNNNDNIFVIIFFLVLGEILYLILVKERTILKYNDYNLKKYFITLGSSYLVNILIINRVDNIFPSMENVKLLVWLFIIGYVFVYIKNNIVIKLPVNNNISFSEDREYIVMQYAKFKSKYSTFISSKYNYLSQVIYSMMIYENYNRPELMRRIDLLKYRLFREENKFGIMQIEKKEPISDIESIEFVLKRLEKIYSANIKSKMSEGDSVKILIKKYYKKEVSEVISIYNIINKFNEG